MKQNTIPFLRVSILIGWLLLMGLLFLTVTVSADEPGDGLINHETDEILQHFHVCKSVWRWSAADCAGAERRPQNRLSGSIDLPQPQIISSELTNTNHIKGLYITYYGLGSPALRERVQTLLETTELNALVMDVKGDHGYLAYNSAVTMAHQIGSAGRPTVKDWANWMVWFEERDIYTIARMVVFKDEPLAAARPEWAVIDIETGDIWRDREGLGWIDPTREEAWDYYIALAVEIAQMGVDEIQLDYIRFPTDGQVSRAGFSEENTAENRVAAITGFLAKMDEALAPYNVKIGADVFGYTTWRMDDMGIGQHLESMAPYIDVISPMVYPSTFGHGLPEHPEYKQAVAFPYEVVNKSTLRAVNRLKTINPNLVVRPWIQDFPDYAFDRRIYTPDEIRLQMAGAIDAGAPGWLLWDPRVIYTEEALLPIGDSS